MAGDGTRLLQDVAERIVIRWLRGQGSADASSTGGMASYGGRAVDISYSPAGSQRRAKLKPDPYYGLDRAKVADRSLTYYREDAGVLALEAVANSVTREPGWMVAPGADELFYYFLAISQPEDEVRALLAEPDPVFFGELLVERDELLVIPMAAARAWFAENLERFATRPVMSGGTSSWYRLVPKQEMEASVRGIRRVGPVFGGLAR